MVNLQRCHCENNADHICHQENRVICERHGIVQVRGEKCEGGSQIKGLTQPYHNQTDTSSTQRRRGRREPQSFIFGHGLPQTPFPRACDKGSVASRWRKTLYDTGVCPSRAQRCGNQSDAGKFKRAGDADVAAPGDGRTPAQLRFIAPCLSVHFISSRLKRFGSDAVLAGEFCGGQLGLISELAAKVGGLFETQLKCHLLNWFAGK